MTSPIPPRARRIRTGQRTSRVAIGVTPDQKHLIEQLAATQDPPLTPSSYVYELLTAALVNAAAAAAEEQGE